MQLNFYEIMGITQDFPQERIPQAFRNRAKQVHPDKCRQQQQNSNNKQATILLLQAYRVLNNPVLRRQYDIQLQLQLKTSQLIVHRYFQHTNIIRKGERLYVQCQQCAGETQISQKDLLIIAQRDKHECFVKCWHCGLSLAIQIE